MIKKLKKCGILSCMLCILLIFFLFPVKAYSADTSLEVNYVHDGVKFSIFLVANIEENGQYAPTGDFAEYSVEIPGSSWRDTAATLAAYAVRDDIAPTATGKIIVGKANFSGLSAGLYLVLGDTCTKNGKIYTPVPVLVIISGESIVIDSKYDCDDVDDEKYISCTVEKIWRQDSRHNRPASVEIELLQNGSVYDSIVLSAENNWKYTWNQLESGYQWQITENNVPDGYTVTVSQSDTTFTVTNTYHDEIIPTNPTEPSNPTDPTKPAEPSNPTGPSEPTEPSNPDEPTDPIYPTNPDIPKTGDDTIIWPYLLMLTFGVSGVAVAVWSKKKEDNE